MHGSNHAKGYEDGLTSAKVFNASAAFENSLKNADKGKTCSDFREVCREYRKALLNRKQQKDERIADAQNKLNSERFKEVFAKEEQDYQHAKIKAQRALEAEKEALLDSKRQRLNDFISAPMKQENASRLLSLSRRKEVSAEELQAIGESLVGDYAATAEFEEICSDKGYTFTTSFGLDAQKANLQTAETLINAAIDNLDQPYQSYIAELLYADVSGPNFCSDIFDALDGRAYSVEAPSVTLKQKINGLIDQAKAEGDFQKEAKLSLLYAKEKDAITTPEEHAAEVEAKAEAIAEGK